jgi:magnesium-transporting ATPase (P-type)
MGTVVRAGSGRGVVVVTGASAEFGRIAVGLGTRQLETEFQAGLRKFSILLVQVAIALTTSIFVINVLLHKPVIDALLFSLAIAVGITPQLLPAVVSTSLAAGSRQMARRKVLVKRLVCNEAAVGAGGAVGGNPLDVALWESPAAAEAARRSRSTARSPCFRSITSGGWPPCSPSG